MEKCKKGIRSYFVTWLGGVAGNRSYLQVSSSGTGTPGWRVLCEPKCLDFRPTDLGNDEVGQSSAMTKSGTGLGNGSMLCCHPRNSLSSPGFFVGDP